MSTPESTTAAGPGVHIVDEELVEHFMRALDAAEGQEPEFEDRA